MIRRIFNSYPSLVGGLKPLKVSGVGRWWLVRGSGYLGYVDSNQGYNLYKWVICPLTRVINLHITSY